MSFKCSNDLSRLNLPMCDAITENVRIEYSIIGGSNEEVRAGFTITTPDGVFECGNYMILGDAKKLADKIASKFREIYG